MTKWFRFIGLVIVGITATAVLFVVIASGFTALIQLFFLNSADRGGEAGWLFFFLALPVVALLSISGGIMISMALHKKFG